MNAPARITFPPFAPAAVRPPPPATDQLHFIHIIDDDAPLGAALSAGLEAHGYRTFFSPNAATGWAEAHARPPDLILCDINMPGKNGHRLLEEIRADPQLGDCLFVFMTGNPLFAQPRTGMDLGADDFLLKPFSLDALIACVSARLQRKAVARQQGEAAMLTELRDGLHKAMSHELLTPLNGIIGFSDMLEQDFKLMPPGEIQEALTGLRQSGQRLHRTLRNYLFTLDRLAPDSATPFPVLPAVTVGQLLAQAAQVAAHRHGRETDLQLEIQAAALAAGPQELSLLVEELVDNACSFSAAGTPVRVRTRRIGANLQLRIGDTGRGITAEQLKHLGAFRQFERSRFEQQGLGVGLFIVRQILRRLGGELSIESLPGTGTTCQVALPVHRAPAAAGGN
jgi:two-component system sensor histidine kinase/response regulator